MIVVWTKNATRELRAIHDYIAQNSRKYAGPQNCYATAAGPFPDRRSQRRRGGLTRVRERYRQLRRALSHGGRSRADSPQFVAEIELHVCVASDHFRSDVERELFDVPSNQDLPDGRRGLFQFPTISFGQPVYLSALPRRTGSGVESVEARTFQRQRRRWHGAGERLLDIGWFEIARSTTIVISPSTAN
jgi:hypothetical protein